MPVNPTKFHLYNVIDTCSIWNIVSSSQFYAASLHAKCEFICTGFVIYECLYKPRTNITETELKLQEILKKEINRGKFQSHHISIEDLQDLEIIENRKKLSKGELSSIVFSKKIRQAFLTDDQGARKLAEKIIEHSMVQTTPHLFGWLFYSGYLHDSDKDKIISDHCKCSRPLARFFEEMYLKALELRLAS